jgi:hypothetical protein
MGIDIVAGEPRLASSLSDSIIVIPSSCRLSHSDQNPKLFKFTNLKFFFKNLPDFNLFKNQTKLKTLRRLRNCKNLVFFLPNY